MTNFGLSHPEAMASIRKIDDALQQTDTLLKKMEQEVEAMVATNWHGNQAGRFHEAMGTHLGDLHQINDTTHRLADNAKNFISTHMDIDSQ